jgi:hypothetical protein
MLGQQRLVGRHHSFSGAKRGPNCKLGWIALAADQFDENLNLLVGRKSCRVGDPAWLSLAKVALLVGPSRRHRDDLDAASAPGRNQIALLGDETHDRGTNRAKPGKTGFQRRNHLSQGTRSQHRGRSTPPRKRDDVVQLFGTGFKEPTQVAGGLANALFVLDQGDSYKAFAVLAKPDARRNRDLCLFDQ